MLEDGWCFTWNMGNACEGNLLRLRSCFVESVGFYPIYFFKTHEACFMGWVWRIRTNECWIGQGLSFSFVLPWFRCIGEPGCIFRCLKASRCFT